jgi:O-antigen/teichoic acid export membrane protein
MNLSQSTLRIFAAKLVNAALIFLGMTYFARSLGSAELGVFFLFQLLLELLSIPSDMGLQFAVEKRISEGESPSEIFATAVVAKIGLLVLIICTIFLAAPWIDSYVGASVAPLLVIGLLVHEGGRLMLRTLAGELRVGSTAELRFVQVFIWIGLGSYFITNNGGARELIYAYLLGWFAVLVLGYHLKSTSFGRPSFTRLHSLFDYSKYSFISYISGYVYNWMDLAIIGFVLTTSAVGQYEMAWRVAMLVTLFSTSLGEVIFPQISKWSAEEATDRIEDLLPDTLTASFVLVIPGFFGVVILSDEILRLLFGDEFAVAWLALILLFGERIIQAGHTILGRALLGINKPKLAARSSVISVILNLILNILLIPTIGIAGAAIATLLASTLNATLHIVYLSRFLDIRVNRHELTWILGGSALMFGVVAGVEQLVVIQSIPVLLGVVLLGVVCYTGVLLTCKSIRLKFSNQTKKIINHTTKL